MPCQANAEYQEVLQKLEGLTTEYNGMYRERMESEERERRLAEERKQAGIKRVRWIIKPKRQPQKP